MPNEAGPTDATPAGGAAGFTLIEVVVALAILALALAAALPQFGSALRLGAEATDGREAVLVAQSALAVLTADPRLADGARDGAADGGWVWRATVRRAATGGDGAVPALLRPFEVTIEVMKTGGRPLARLTTIALGRPS